MPGNPRYPGPIVIHQPAAVPSLIPYPSYAANSSFPPIGTTYPPQLVNSTIPHGVAIPYPSPSFPGRAPFHLGPFAGEVPAPLPRLSTVESYQHSRSHPIHRPERHRERRDYYGRHRERSRRHSSGNSSHSSGSRDREPDNLRRFARVHTPRRSLSHQPARTSLQVPPPSHTVRRSLDDERLSRFDEEQRRDHEPSPARHGHHGHHTQDDAQQQSQRREHKRQGDVQQYRPGRIRAFSH